MNESTISQVCIEIEDTTEVDVDVMGADLAELSAGTCTCTCTVSFK